MLRPRLVCVGRMPPRAPERALLTDYLTRFAQTGRRVGLGPVQEIEVEAKSGGAPEEARLLARAIPDGAILAILDERGDELTSPDFAARLATWRDDAREVALVIGGADGIDPALRARADLAIRFGRMVWPHMLARVMLGEQLYRAATILTGSPYHRA